jgi:hypothetical protein
VITVNKLSRTAFCLITLFTFLLSHGVLLSEKVISYDTKAEAIILMDQAPEDLTGPDDDHKKAFIIVAALTVLLVIQLSISRRIPANAFTTVFAFLTAVFYQSNYVIKPLRF